MRKKLPITTKNSDAVYSNILTISFLVSNLTRRLMIVENEKTEGDRILEEIRVRNEDLKRKYDLLMLDNHHRIHVQEHVHEISEMKRLTGNFYLI